MLRRTPAFNRYSARAFGGGLFAATPMLRCGTSNLILPSINRSEIDSHESELLPQMNFLANPGVLLETIDGTMETCDKLLALIKTAKTPKEKHDIIDSCSNVLCLFLDPCEFVRQVHPLDSYKAAAIQGFSRVHTYMCEINARRDLYDVLLELSTPESQRQLSLQENKNVAQLKRDMESNGIHLSDGKRKIVSDLNVEKEELAMRFLSEKDKDPYEVLRALLKVRYDQARILGYESCAHHGLQGTMMGDPSKVWRFLCGVAHKYRGLADKEVLKIREYQGLVKTRDELTDEDRAKMAINIRNQLEPEGLDQYFTVGNCVRGIQCLCAEVFGLTLEAVPFAKEELFHKDATKFHVWDEDQNFVGVIVLDMFARASKHCQAGHLTVQLGCQPHVETMRKVGVEMPTRQYPIVVLTCNAGSQTRAHRRPDGSLNAETTLMMAHEVTTCFHEFGHALHTLFGQTQVQNLAGTRSSVDYVELFSQFFERFLTSHEFLKLWAHKVGTGEPITKELVDKRNTCNDAFKHLDYLDQVVLAAVDQCLHGPMPFVVYFPHGGDGNLGKRTLGHIQEYRPGMFGFAHLVQDIALPLSAVKPTELGVLRSLSFDHLASYPANYYGYLYSAAFAKRIWVKYFEHNPLNRKEGMRLAKELMSYGAACNPREALAEYLHEDLDDVERWC